MMRILLPKRSFRRRVAKVCLALLLPAFVCAVGISTLRAQTGDSSRPGAQSDSSPQQETFATPEDAMRALIAAAKADDREALGKIFGPDADKLFSGDPVEDSKDLADFSAAAAESAKLQKSDDNKYTLVVGKDDWSTPIPIAERTGRWIFDTDAGLQDVLDRRIGENELSAIHTCRAYVLAQWEYFTEDDWGHDGVNAYAQKFMSTPGQHDGLFWETAEDEDPSPLGELVAEARAEGYGPANPAASGTSLAAAENSETKSLASNVQESEGAAGSEAESENGNPAHTRRPYHGYYFKILKQQGPAAPGGKYNYVINGNMIGGFALVAYPAKWNDSGIMTFIVNQQGRVYQKNLGPHTDKLASQMTTYNPDETWERVNED